MHVKFLGNSPNTYRTLDEIIVKTCYVFIPFGASSTELVNLIGFSF